MDKLKPCPFCGGTNVRIVRFYSNYDFPKKTRIETGSAIVCDDCLIDFHQEEACCVEENVAAWNRRASDG